MSEATVVAGMHDVLTLLYVPLLATGMVEERLSAPPSLRSVQMPAPRNSVEGAPCMPTSDECSIMEALEPDELAELDCDVEAADAETSEVGSKSRRAEAAGSMLDVNDRA